jgi:hypothetical protein
MVAVHRQGRSLYPLLGQAALAGGWFRCEKSEQVFACCENFLLCPTVQDAALFEAIIADLFPAVRPAAERARQLRAALARSLVSAGLQPADALVLKALQLQETLGVRFGVMLIGPAGDAGNGGRTSAVPRGEAIAHATRQLWLTVLKACEC